MRKFKISYAKQYTDGQGQEKTAWKTLGYANEIVSQEGKTTIHGEFDAIPPNWNGEFKLFLQDEQQNQQGGGNQQQQPNNQGGYNQPQQQQYQQPNQPQQNY